MIDAFAEKGKFSDEDIAFHVTRELGFGERFTKNYLQKAVERKFFLKNEDGIISTREVRS
jgi:hypothetical protein